MRKNSDTEDLLGCLGCMAFPVLFLLGLCAIVGAWKLFMFMIHPMTPAFVTIPISHGSESFTALSMVKSEAISTISVIKPNPKDTAMPGPKLRLGWAKGGFEDYPFDTVEEAIEVAKDIAKQFYNK